MYPKAYRKLTRHWLLRFGFMGIGVLLLYAPFAYLTRLFLFVIDKPHNADVHSICMRMPIQWLMQPWMYGTMFETPTYLVAVIFLPVMALFLSPLFCGWMCPAGSMTEFLSRIVPPRFQIDLSGRFSAVPVRYGFTLGMMAVTFVGGNACCSFCNFTHAQNLISAVFGDPFGLTYWASFSVVSFGLWFFVLGLFTRGGRGWCNLLCPAGALMGLFHFIGVKLGLGRSVQINRTLCSDCQLCKPNCPTWAIQGNAEGTAINPHACNGCMDCVKICPTQAISYVTNQVARGQAAEAALPGD